APSTALSTSSPCTGTPETVAAWWPGASTTNASVAVGVAGAGTSNIAGVWPITWPVGERTSAPAGVDMMDTLIVPPAAGPPPPPATAGPSSFDAGATLSSYGRCSLACIDATHTR